jgi:hypothetical protein
MMLDHSPEGRARHPPNAPKLMIFEPDEYSDYRTVLEGGWTVDED